MLTLNLKPPDVPKPFLFDGDGHDLSLCQGWSKRPREQFIPASASWDMSTGQRPCANTYMPNFGDQELKTYAGIGSRQTPEETLMLFTCLGVLLMNYGFILRSGGAPGADQAFDRYVPNDKRKVFVPWNGFEGYPMLYDIPEKAYAIAQLHHPNWDRLKPAVKNLMARNTQQILGRDLQSKSKFVLCWTPDGCEHDFLRTYKTGGTGQAIAVATTYGIPVINFANNNPLGRLSEVLGISHAELTSSLRSIETHLFSLR